MPVVLRCNFKHNQMQAIRFVLGFCFLLAVSVLFAQQEDTAFIQPYEKASDIELYNGYNNTHLRFHTKGASSGEALNFFSNDGLFTGIYLNYKWAVIGYGINVPFTSRDNLVKDFKSYRLRLNSYYKGWGFAGSSDIYKGLLSHRYKNKYTPVAGVKYTSISADIFHVNNPSHYSYRAALYLAEQQLRSCGSLLFHIHPYYYALGLQSNSSPASDSVQHFINGNPRWLSLIASLGYGYNFVWNKGKWIVSPRAETGFGGLYQFGIEEKLRPTVFYRLALTAGYSTQNRYAYLAAEDAKANNALATETISDNRLRLSIAAGYRLHNLKKKVLGLL